ncbi:hypothetical protein ACWEQL_15040 [Kitasatospora sp. NPDC004240]
MNHTSPASLSAENLAEWREELAATLAPFLETFEAAHGYAPGENGAVPADEGTLEVAERLRANPAVAPDLAAVYEALDAVDLPDIGSGYFVHPARYVLADLVYEGTVDGDGTMADAVVFGSDGGGRLFAADLEGRVHRSRIASRDSEFEPYADGIAAFLAGLLRAAQEREGFRA